MRVLHLVVIALLALISNAVLAHEMSMAEMEVRETAPGEFLWQWTASGNRPADTELTPLNPLPEDRVAATDYVPRGVRPAREHGDHALRRQRRVGRGHAGRLGQRRSRCSSATPTRAAPATRW